MTHVDLVRDRLPDVAGYREGIAPVAAILLEDPGHGALVVAEPRPVVQRPPSLQLALLTDPTQHGDRWQLGRSRRVPRG